jgi:putative solute:sodium symporter small subunit
MPTETPPPTQQQDDEQARLRLIAARQAHWHSTRRMTALLLALWLVTGFCSVYFARDLAHLMVFGWPLSFYMAAQGSSLIYLAIIGGYAWRMRWLDRRCERMLEQLP